MTEYSGVFRRLGILAILLMCFGFFIFSQYSETVFAKVCCADCYAPTEVCAEACNGNEECIDECLAEEAACLSTCSTSPVYCQGGGGGGGGDQGSSCSSNSQCQLGYSCVNGICHSNSGQLCYYDYQCPPGQHCVGHSYCAY